MRNYYSFSLASILAVALAAPAFAQDVPASQTVAQQQGVISYTPADFAAARPNTAMDMIGRIPGFSFSAGDQVRGFAGAAGNVLVDGQRPTAKTDSLDSILSRIQISQVERIDVIRGGAPGIDMQGQTVVANVITKKQDSFQQVFTVGGLLYAKTGDTIPTYGYTASRRVGEHQFDFNFSRGLSLDDSVGFGWRMRQDATTGAITRFEDADTEGDGFVYTGRANYKGPQFGGTLSINGLLSTDEFKNESHFISPTSDERFIDRSANDRTEFGVNFKRPLSEGLELEVLGLNKWAQGSGDSLGVVAGEKQTFTVDAEAGETIGRGILRYKVSPDLSFEGGGEVAYNYRDQTIALFDNDNAPVSLPITDVTVEELRGEAFAQGTWRISPDFSLEGGVRVERSKIEQSGDLTKERSFTYPKPRLVATWSPTKDDQLRLRVEREVGQLNFRDFSASVNLSSGVVSGGNSDLRPDKTWIYEAAYEKRFWDGAAAVLTFRHDEISDVVDLFPFLVDSDGDNIPDTRIMGPGNIGPGKNDSISLDLTLPLKGFGLAGGELKAETSWQNSEVTDPLTGEKRRISGQRPNNINVNYRQDVPELNLTFGLGWFAGWSEDYYYLQEVQNLRIRDFFFSFAEWKPDPGFSLRVELNNFDPYSFNIVRGVFDNDRDIGSLSFIETERRNSQVMGQIRARWTIG